MCLIADRFWYACIDLRRLVFEFQFNNDIITYFVDSTFPKFNKEFVEYVVSLFVEIQGSVM